MNQLSPYAAFQLAVFRFRMEPKDERARAELGQAIEAWRQAGWAEARPYSRQLVTACERALSCRPDELHLALKGITEIFELAKTEASMEEQADRWRERADING